MAEYPMTRVNQVVLIAAEGRLDSENAPRLARAFDEALSQGYSKFVLDLTNVDYMSSAGLRELVRAYKVAQRQGGDLRLANPPDRILSVLQISGLEDTFRIFDSGAAALRSF